MLFPIFLYAHITLLTDSLHLLYAYCNIVAFMTPRKATRTIRSQGGRMTKIRAMLLTIFSDAKCILSQKDILALYKKQQFIPNRSTIFRELVFLTTRGIIIKHTIAGTAYYEMPRDHHHHLICLGCHTIKKIPLHNILKPYEETITKYHKFAVLYHCLEFYGYCRTCKATKEGDI